MNCFKQQCQNCKKTTTISGRLMKFGEPKHCMHCGRKFVTDPNQLAKEVENGRLTPNEARMNAGVTKLPSPEADQLFIKESD